MTLRIESCPDGRLRVQRGFLRQLKLTSVEIDQIAQAAGIAQEWPPGFIDQLKDACFALLTFNNRLAQYGAPATVLGDAEALTDLFGKMVLDFGIHVPEANDES